MAFLNLVLDYTRFIRRPWGGSGYIEMRAGWGDKRRITLGPPMATPFLANKAALSIMDDAPDLLGISEGEALSLLGSPDRVLDAHPLDSARSNQTMLDMRAAGEITSPEPVDVWLYETRTPDPRLVHYRDYEIHRAILLGASSADSDDALHDSYFSCEKYFIYDLQRLYRNHYDCDSRILIVLGFEGGKIQSVSPFVYMCSQYASEGDAGLLECDDR